MQVETLLQELGFDEVYNESTFGAANFTTVLVPHVIIPSDQAYPKCLA